MRYLLGNCVSRPIERPSRARNKGRRQHNHNQHGQAQNHSKQAQQGQIREHQPVQQLQHR